MATKLKTLKKDETVFYANGKKYIVETSLSVKRFEEFEKLQLEVGFGVNFKNIFNNLKDAWTHLNKQEPAEAAVVLHNIMNGVSTNIEKRRHPMLELCALFINTPNEDRTVYSAELAKEKITDWEKEGIDINDFFLLGFNLVDGFLPILKEHSQDTSKGVKAEIPIVKPPVKKEEKPK